MPAVGEVYDAVAQQVDVLAARDFNGPSPVSRAAIDHSALVPEALHVQPAAKRQQQIIIQGIIPTYYNLDGPEPGTVVGIVLGSVAGFLLIVWLLHSLTQGNRRGGGTTAMAGEEEIVVRRPRRNSQGTRSRRSSHTQVREVSRSPRRSAVRSQVIVDERMAPPPPRQRSVTRQRSFIVEDRHRVPGDDVVEVIEEHDDYRSRRGGRRGGYR